MLGLGSLDFGGGFFFVFGVCREGGGRAFPHRYRSGFFFLWDREGREGIKSFLFQVMGATCFTVSGVVYFFFFGIGMGWRIISLENAGG